MTTGPILTTERLTLRPLAPRDYAAMESFVLSDRSRFVRSEARVGVAWRAFAAMIGHWSIHGFGLFAITVTGDDTARGAVGPWFPADWPEREFGWTIWSEADEGKGYVAEAMRAVRAHAWDDLGWTTAVSYIDPANARSIATAERLGCTLDETAARPDPEDLVYRHPGPEAAR